MNHDVSHCADYDPQKCPKTCYRAQVTAELENRPDLVGIPLSFMNFYQSGDPECPLAPSYVPPKPPPSHGDAIRDMDDYSLANMFATLKACPGNVCNQTRCRKFATCVLCWLDYLKVRETK